MRSSQRRGLVESDCARAATGKVNRTAKIAILEMMVRVLIAIGMGWSSGLSGQVAAGPFADARPVLVYYIHC